MLCENDIKRELKRLPALYKMAVKEGQLAYALEIMEEKTILEFVLEDECTCEK